MKKMPLFNDPQWEFLSQDERDTTVFDLMKKQFMFNKKNVPFYARNYETVGKLESYQDCIEKIPTLKKSVVRKLSPYDLLPKQTIQNLNTLLVHRGTGGTTGEPTSVFYSENDWRAATYAANRILYKPMREINKPLVAFNNYNQGHISGPIFNDMVRNLGGVAITRNFGSDDESALRQMIKHKCNLLICPPISTHKGGTLESLLDMDAKLGTNYIHGDNIDCLFLSSTGLTRQLYDEITSLGIRHVFNFYGSTDVLPVAVSCEKDPFTLHLIEGHIHAAVIDHHQKMVSSGKRGMLVTGRLAAITKSHRFVCAEGTELLNFYLGDEVLLKEGRCKCGRTTRTISDIKRVIDIEEKLSSGCQLW